VDYLLRIITLFVLSSLLFLVVANILKTNEPTISFFLSLIATHLILEKNTLIYEKVEEMFHNSNDEEVE
jgi:predicted tellurium resistance membrane protein TerC